MELIRRDGSRAGICREHREVFEGKKCVKCEAAEKGARSGARAMEKWYERRWGAEARKVPR